MAERITATVKAALEAYERGYTPLPILDGEKRPLVSSWTRLSFDSKEEVREKFTKWGEQGATNIGILLGEASGGLMDVDLDHPKTGRLKHHFLPPTEMRSGRAGNSLSHFWYRAKPGTLPGAKRHKMPDGGMAVELRSDRAQTVIPPSVHPSGQSYLWEGKPWGGEAGPAEVDGRVLAVQVALLGLGTVLIDSWPKQGGRHDAYLALAGGLLRFGESDVHPYWEKNAGVLIRAMASATLDDDGPDAREQEVMQTTLTRLREGRQAVGFGRLAELITQEAADQVRRLVAEVESAAGFQSRNAAKIEGTLSAPLTKPALDDEVEQQLSAAKSERMAANQGADSERDPLSERVGSWEPVDLEPYLAGQVRQVEPELLKRDDGQCLLYPGRVNMIYGSSESAKSWIALWTSMQEMAKGERVLYLDFEDDPVSTLGRLRALGAGNDDIRLQFTYIRPEEPLASMQRDRWGKVNMTEDGKINLRLLERAIAAVDPSLIVADGMTVLYGLHGLDSNDAVSTDVITTWLKSLTRNGRSTVVIIDHTTKGAERGTMPIGSQHKVAMVQGAMLQAWAVKQPMPGAVGEIELVVLKDRPGQVRAISQRTGTKAQIAAVVTMDSREPGVTTMTIAAPPDRMEEAKAGVVDLKMAEAAAKATEQVEYEQAILRAYGGIYDRRMSKQEIMDALPMPYRNRPGKVGQAIQRLRNQQWLEKQGSTKDTTYVLQIGVDEYRDGADD